MSDTIANPKAAMFAAIAKLQAELPRIAKGETAQVRSDKGNYTYKYADLADVAAAVMPRLAQFGPGFLARPTLNTEGKFVLAYSLTHESGEREDGEYPLTTGASPQATGSAITYARRYCLCAVTGTTPDGDDDGKAAEDDWRQSAPVRPAQQRQERPAAQAGRPQAVPAQRQPEAVADDVEAQWVATFRGRIDQADITSVRTMRIEMAKAVQAKVIAPDTANELGGLLRDRTASLEGASDAVAS